MPLSEFVSENLNLILALCVHSIISSFLFAQPHPSARSVVLALIMNFTIMEVGCEEEEFEEEHAHEFTGVLCVWKRDLDPSVSSSFSLNPNVWTASFLK